MLFDTQGKATEYALVDEAQYPAKFAENVKERVACAKIDPPQEDGKAVTLRTAPVCDWIFW